MTNKTSAHATAQLLQSLQKLQADCCELLRRSLHEGRISAKAVNVMDAALRSKAAKRPSGQRPFNFRWSRDNKKEKKISAVCFGLPPVKTCPGALWCADYCWGLTGYYATEKVKRRLRHNLAVIVGLFRQGRIADLAALLVEDIVRLSRFPRVRINEVGDFFHQLVYDAWCEVARRLPEKEFFAYTASLHLDLWTNKPANLIVVQSEASRYAERIDATRPTSHIFLNQEELAEANAALVAQGAVPYTDASATDAPVVVGDLRIGLSYHGVARQLPVLRAALATPIVPLRARGRSE